MKTYKQLVEENNDLSYSDVKTLNNLGQKMFNTKKCSLYDVRWRFASHSKDRTDHKRNEAPITMAHYVRIIKKGIPILCSRMEEFINNKGCFIDQKTFTNLPFVVEDDVDGVLHIGTTSAQNKKDYWLFPDQIPIYIR